MANKVLNVYNLARLGVDVDSDDLHVATGAWRKAQNLERSAETSSGESVATRPGLRELNLSALGAGPVRGGIPLPAFEAGSGEATLLLGFGD